MRMKYLSTGALALLALSPLVLATSDFSLALVAEPKETNGYVSNALEGLERFAQDQGLGEDNYQYLSTTNEAGAVGNLQELASSGQEDLIVTLGEVSESATAEFATTYPDQHFLIIDGVVEGDNVTSIKYDHSEAAFLAGLAAGSETQTGKIGFVGSWDEDLAEEYELAFKAGISLVNSQAQVLSHRVQSVDDENGAREAAHEMIDQDVDVIYTAASRADNGVFNAGQDLKREDPSRPLWVIGSEVDRTDQGMYMNADNEEKSFTLTSTIKRYDRTLEQAAAKASAGELEPGVQVLGIEEEQIDILKGQLSGGTYDVVNRHRDEIMKGSYDVAQIIEEYLRWNSH
ncbi:BMP family lipoprotein [Hutsoniella sourekii]|uniref:BMP family lipoprotein n=1 Tax=Hutsoniella sourekii TaxID=87650 RepID=UPI000486CB42|nr:BMP family ABC transporter substrate-binding protein [Hutsoniella sourekii]